MDRRGKSDGAVLVENINGKTWQRFWDINRLIDVLDAEVQTHFAEMNGDHDKHHLKRVLNLALRIQREEGGDLRVIIPAAFLHEFHRLQEKKKGRWCHPRSSLGLVKSILVKIGVDKTLYRRILDCIQFHSTHPMSKVPRRARTLELMIIQDADRLDMLGTIGLARAFTYCGAKGCMIFDPEIPLTNQARFTDGNVNPSEIHHLLTHILRLKDEMNTGTAKKLAVRRHRVSRFYVKDFLRQWRGEV